MAPPEPLSVGVPPPESLPPAQHSPEESATDFASLISSLGPPRFRSSASKFIKKLEGIPENILLPSLPHRAVISLPERGLVGQFTGLWPSLKSVQQ